MTGDCEVSVIIATRNRAAALAETLGAFVQARVSSPWELLAVDNGSGETPAVLASFMERLPLKPLAEPVPGKARALNRGLTVARGRLILFTDDDITICPAWISELERAAREWPTANVFCGPIVPQFPSETPAWIRDHPFAAPAFGKFTPALPECLLDPPLVPFGGNFAVRASAIEGCWFHEALGPGERNLMNEDTEFLRRLRARGETIVYVPGAGVTHRLLPEHVSIPRLFERAFTLGRSTAVERGEALLVELSAHTARAGQPPEVAQFERGAQINFYFGQLSELFASANHKQCDVVRGALAGTDWHAHRQLLAPAAARVAEIIEPVMGGFTCTEIVSW